VRRLLHALFGCRRFFETAPGVLRCCECGTAHLLPVGYRADDPRLNDLVNGDREGEA
jgi:hypothetical protein